MDKDDQHLSEEGPGHLDIRIRSASLSDSGEYQCRARSARDSHIAPPVRLNVLNATTIAGIDSQKIKVMIFHKNSIFVSVILCQSVLIKSGVNLNKCYSFVACRW